MTTYANVDGIPFTMPVRSQGSPVLFGCFSIDAGAAGELLPGQVLHPCRLLRRGLLSARVDEGEDDQEDDVQRQTDGQPWSGNFRSLLEQWKLEYLRHACQSTETTRRLVDDRQLVCGSRALFSREA